MYTIFLLILNDYPLLELLIQSYNSEYFLSLYLFKLCVKELFFPLAYLLCKKSWKAQAQLKSYSQLVFTLTLYNVELIVGSSYTEVLFKAVLLLCRTTKLCEIIQIVSLGVRNYSKWRNRRYLYLWSPQVNLFICLNWA